MERNSQDKLVNKRGEDLLDLCKSLDLHIANGRKIGDPFGNYTCLKWNGNSVVDYLLTSNSIFDQVPTFKVGTFHPMLSDHCPLFYNLEVPQNLDEIKKESLLKKAPRNFFWSDSENAKFLSSLKSEDNQKKLTSILYLDFKDTNEIVESVTNLLTEIAETTKIKQSPISKFDPNKNPSWFDKTCSELKREIIILGKKVKRNPNNEEQKRLLTKLKRSLTTTVKKSKLAYKDTILQKMKWSSKRSKLFWKLVAKLSISQMIEILSQEFRGKIGRHISKTFYKIQN